jgi:hypothetical protein
MNIVRRLRSLLTPYLAVLGTGIATLIEGARVMLSAAPGGSPSTFILGLGILVAGCLISALGGYKAGSDWINQ